MNFPSDESLVKSNDRPNEFDRFRISNNNENPL